ncbi:MAG: STAS/SEC14 domain-containing protein [Marinoscillum sp.]
MLLNSTNVDVLADEDFHSSHSCLKFIFKGKFTEEASDLSTQIWDQEFKSNPDRKFILIWDCVQMTGFEMSARREWIKCMQELHENIDKIIVVSDNVLIRGSARLMLKLFSFESEVFSTYQEIAVAYPNKFFA